MTIYTNIDMDMDTRIDTLGEAKIESPISKMTMSGC
jgi:hypothetical protein